MRLLCLSTLAFASVVASACSSLPMASPTSPSTATSGASTTSALSALSGTWSSSPTATGAGSAVVSGVCGNTQYTVTPVGSDRATVTYGATCMGIGIRGTGDGVASGNIVNWNTAGSAGPCAFTLNGTATPVNGTSARITYSGTVCDLPVSGSEVLTR